MQGSFWLRTLNLVALLAFCAAPFVAAEEAQPQNGHPLGNGNANGNGGEPKVVAAPAKDPESEAASRQMPQYRHPYKDGLYSTIVALISFGAPDIEKQKKEKLKVDGFKNTLQIQSIVQPDPAPLVVVLVGLDGKADTPIGRLLPYWLNHAGYNVLSFDSPFRPSYQEVARTGVTGNVAVEAADIAKIIDTYVKQPALKGKFTKIGIVGYSLGATHTVALARMAADGKLPFELSGALAFSPPIVLKETAAILDGWYSNDRFNYTFVEMGKTFMNHEPVKEGEAIPFKADFMRAGISYEIREQFTEIVNNNDRVYRLKLIKDEDPGSGEIVNREEEARAWGFKRFFENMSFPYWKDKAKFKSIDDLWNTADITQLATKLPEYARVVVCENDPLNRPEDLELLKKTIQPKSLVILPTGGHMGYIGSAWCYHTLVKLFKPN